MAQLEPEAASAFLREQLARSRSGHGRLILVSGAVASGKTRLLEDLIDSCVREGVRTLSATGAADEQACAGGVLDQLLDGAELPVDLAERAVRLLADSRVAVPDSDAGEVAGYPVCGLARMLADLARDEPVVIVVDDIHLADGVSVLLLRQLQRRLRATRLTIVLGLRDPDAAGDPGRQFRWRAHHEVRLGRMSEHTVHRMLVNALGAVRGSALGGTALRPEGRPSAPGRRLDVCPERPQTTEYEGAPDRRPGLPHSDPSQAARGRSTDRDLNHEQLLDDRVPDGLAALVHQLSGGVPLLVVAAIHDHVRIGADGAPEAVGPSYRDAVGRYLDRWDPPLRDVAGSLAAIGCSAWTRDDPAGPACTGGEIRDIRDLGGVAAAEALAASGLLLDGWFRHPAIAAAILSGLAPAARAAAHLRAAELKNRLAAPVREVAAHLLAADLTRPTGPHWASPVLRRAAELADAPRPLAPEVAASEAEFVRQSLELAVLLASSDTDKRSILVDLARHTWRTSPSAGRGYLDLLREIPSVGGTVPPAQAAAFAREARWRGDEAGHRDNHPPRGPDTPDAADARAEALHRLAHAWWFGPMGPGPFESAEPGDPWLCTAVELTRIWSESGNEASTAAAERLLRGCRLSDDTLEALMTAVLALVLADRTTEAESWWRTLKAEADRRNAVTWQAMLIGMWSSAVLRRGDVTYAADLARHAISLLPDREWGAALADPLATLLAALTAAGDHERAAEVVARPVPDGLERTVAGVRFIRARGQHHLAAGRLLAAVSDFSRCGRLLVARGTDLPGLVPWRADLAAANLCLGDRAAAQALAAEQLARAAEADRHTRGLARRVQALAGEPDDLRRVLSEAAELFAAGGDQCEALRTARMLELIPSHGAGGGAGWTVSRGSARAPISRTASDQAVAARALARASVSTARSQLEPGGAEVISEAEQRVAALAALGMTNQEISSTLTITVSTVEQHLTRVYRKLGIRGRGELAAGLGG